MVLAYRKLYLLVGKVPSNYLLRCKLIVMSQVIVLIQHSEILIQVIANTLEWFLLLSNINEQFPP